jgi:HSP20 family protein
MKLIRRQETAPSNPPAASWDPFRMMQEMTRWDPFREMSPLLSRDDFKSMFVPDVDVKETPTAYVFKADVPGMKEKDIELSLTGNRLTLSGKREGEKREENAMYFTLERSYGSFTRSFTLPTGTDTEHATADLKEGVLTITVPKMPEMQAKKIPVTSPTDKPKASA